MTHRNRSISSGIVLAAAAFVLNACTEEVAPAQPQAQTPTTATTEQQAVMDGTAQQGSGSALGGAKRASENIVQKAEQHSQTVAEQADQNQNPE